MTLDSPSGFGADHSGRLRCRSCDRLGGRSIEHLGSAHDEAASAAFNSAAAELTGAHPISHHPHTAYNRKNQVHAMCIVLEAARVTRWYNSECCMVFAHPDDEILWFSSILHQCRSVLVCFGPSATSKESWDGGRAVLMETYPLTKVRFLKVRQSDAFLAANWNKPKEADSGLQLRRRSSLYEKNAEKLLPILEAELKYETLVFTHNPWGEYGNEEYVQVFRVLDEIKRKTRI